MYICIACTAGPEESNIGRACSLLACVLWCDLALAVVVHEGRAHRCLSKLHLSGCLQEHHAERLDPGVPESRAHASVVPRNREMQPCLTQSPTESRSESQHRSGFSYHHTRAEARSRMRVHIFLRHSQTCSENHFSNKLVEAINKFREISAKCLQMLQLSDVSNNFPHLEISVTGR